MPVPSLEDIQSYNPWTMGESFKVPSFQRAARKKIEQTIREGRFVVALSGLRRVGKTTLMKQIGNDLKQDKFFFSFEEDVFANYESLKAVVETFVRKTDRPIIFLDEIGRVKGWAGLVKKYHDLQKARFVVSGSSSLHLSKGKESLAGRLAEYRIDPWKFNEYLRFHGIDAPALNASDIERSFSQWNHAGEEHTTAFLRQGAFPESFSMHKESDIRRYVKTTTVDKIVFEDIPATFAVEAKDKLYDIMTYIGQHSGDIFNPSHLGGALELSKDTVKRYVFYLRHSYLADILPIQGSTVKSFRKPNKAYTTCPSISYALSNEYNESRLVETAVFSKLKSAFERVYFYRDAQKREVDFTGPLTVESKWTHPVTSGDLRNLEYYMAKKNTTTAYVVTKEFDVKHKQGKTIYQLPLAFFLLLELEPQTA